MLTKIINPKITFTTNSIRTHVTQDNKEYMRRMKK